MRLANPGYGYGGLLGLDLGSKAAADAVRWCVLLPSLRASEAWLLKCFLFCEGPLLGAATSSQTLVRQSSFLCLCTPHRSSWSGCRTSMDLGTWRCLWVSPLYSSGAPIV